MSADRNMPEAEPTSPRWIAWWPHLLEAPERHPARTIAVVGLLFGLAYMLSLVLLPKPDGRILRGDALHHYVQLRSAAFDGDLHFQNEYMRLYGIAEMDSETRWIFVDLTPTGHVRNLMPVGPALLSAPAFLIVTFAVWLANLAGAGYPLDGYGRLFQATAGLTGTAAAGIGVWLACLTCMQYFRARAAIWACLVAWLASSAIYYSVISPTYSHAASLLGTSAFWYVFVRMRDSLTRRKYALLGALVGVAALMRWQDAVLMGVVGLDLLWRTRGGMSPAGAALRGLAAAAAAALIFAPQMVVWQVLYGQPLAIPQGGGFMHWSDPALLDVLVSTRRGLLSWTPVIVFALAGLVPLSKRDRLLGTAAVLFFSVSWYVNAAVADWWAGEAFGARRFVSCLPIFTLGLAALFDRWAPPLRRLALVSTAAVVHTLLLLVQYQAFLKGLRSVVPYPDTPYALWLARFRAPVDLAVWWWNRL